MTRASRPMWEKRKVKNLLTAVRHLDRLLMSDCSSVVTVPVPSDLASETGHFLSKVVSNFSDFNKTFTTIADRDRGVQDHARHCTAINHMRITCQDCT